MLLKTFSDSVVASAIFCGVVCWNSSISTAERKWLDKLIKKASSVLGCPLVFPLSVKSLGFLSTNIQHILYILFKNNYPTPLHISLNPSMLFLITVKFFFFLCFKFHLRDHTVSYSLFLLHAGHSSTGTLEFPQ